MKFNFEGKPKVNLTDKKAVAKAELEQKKRTSAVMRSTDYKAQQEKIDAPFGKAFKTGAAESKKDYKREKFRKGKDY